MPEPREAVVAKVLPQSEGSPVMDQTARGQQNPGVSNRTHWKNTILAGLANYIDAGSIVAGVIIPWTLYTMYGDRGILQRHFASMTAWMEYLERTNLRTRELGNSYNDWLAPG
jgi:hypothetical protein